MAIHTQAGAERVAADFDQLLQHNADEAPDLKSVLSTAELKRRPSRPPDHAGENRALIALVQDLALTTNAAKYGALSVPEGHVQIKWSHAADGRLVIRWIETGGPPVTPPTRQGFGTRLIRSMIRDQLNGEGRLDWHPEGLACEIAIPM